jgi:hypothetical protein
MDFNAGSFLSQVKVLLDAGDQGLADLVEAYNWANAHLKEIHKYFKDYTQDWLKKEIHRVYNADPELYVRAALHLGGSRDRTGMDRGIKLMRRFGYWECYRADKLLGRDQMRALVGKVTDSTTTDKFHEIVDVMAEVLRGKEDKGGPIKIDYRKEYHRLSAENAKLKQEADDLRKQIEWFQSHVKLVCK